jgi:hypothetical protein
VIGLVTREHVKGTPHYRVGDRDNGPLLPTPGREAMIQGRQVRIFGVGCCMGHLDETRAQRPIPFPSLARALDRVLGKIV